ncbi:hypothetical protein [Agromyces sp. Marseille-P2726]|nr:hypothetical protein [Agromyces sp. Marseille-P2726]
MTLIRRTDAPTGAFATSHRRASIRLALRAALLDQLTMRTA